MIVYLAGCAYPEHVFPRVSHRFNRMESFWYVTKSPALQKYRPLYNRFMLDSGAFTFIMDKSSKRLKETQNAAGLRDYTERYIEYVRDNSVQHFFEMDVDSVFGYGLVKKLRNRIEAAVGRQSIPVYHMSRGIDEWRAMCKDYQYIALGIAGKDVRANDINAFRAFVNDAHASGCKVHGLGITGMRALSMVPFDSVDSSSWTTGNQYSTVYMFDGRHVRPNNSAVKGRRIKDHRLLAEHNLTQWIRFSNAVEKKRTA